MLEPTEEQKAQIDNLIVKLADESYEVRAAAKLGLLRIGPAVEGQLRKIREETHDADLRDSADKLLVAVNNPLRKAKIGDWAVYSQLSYGLILEREIKYVVTDVTETDITLECTRLLKEPEKSLMTIKFERPNRFMYLADFTFKLIATTDETLTANRKQFDTQCTEFETSIFLFGNEIISKCKLWTSDNAPLDGTVRLENVTGDKKIVRELQDYGHGK